MKRLALSLSGVALALALASCNAAPPPHSVYQLPSGRQVKVIGMGKMFFSKGEPALMLKYQTDLPTQDVPQLRREAEEIWQVFRIDVEREGLKAAIISANEAPRRFLLVSSSKGHNFVIQKTDGGKWEFLDDRTAARKS